MLKIPYNNENLPQLHSEVAALEIPAFVGLAKLEREVDDRGRCMLVTEDGKEVTRLDNGFLAIDVGLFEPKLDEDGTSVLDKNDEPIMVSLARRIAVQDTKLKKTVPYLLIKGDLLTKAQKKTITDKITSHIPKDVVP